MTGQMLRRRARPRLRGTVQTRVSKEECCRTGATSSGTSTCNAQSGQRSRIARNPGIMRTVSPKYLNWIARIFSGLSISVDFSRRRASGLKLELVEFLVNTALLDQLGVPAGFDDAPLVKHDNQVGLLHGRKPVGDTDGCATD